MKEGYIIRDQSKAHSITATVVDWIDIFTRQRYRYILLKVRRLCAARFGISDGTPEVASQFGQMPTKTSAPDGKWNLNNARFKFEKTQVNIALGQTDGKAMKIFNNNMLEFEFIKVISGK